MLDLPERPVIPPNRSKHYANDLDAPGPLDRSIKAVPDELEQPVSTKADKQKKAKEMGRRLTLLEKQLYGSESGYGAETEKHELDHSLADTDGRFRLVYDKKNKDIIPAWESGGIRSPKKRMKIASAPGDDQMSEGDKRVYQRAKNELKQQRLKTILITSVAATPFICGGLIYLASH